MPGLYTRIERSYFLWRDLSSALSRLFHNSINVAAGPKQILPMVTAGTARKREV